MPSDDLDDLAHALSTSAIVGIVVGSIIGLAVCIGFVVLLVCIIKQCTRSSHPNRQGMVLQPQPYAYPHSWATEYPPNTTSVSNYPPAYPSAPPPYIAPASAYNKSPYA